MHSKFFLFFKSTVHFFLKTWHFEDYQVGLERRISIQETQGGEEEEEGEEHQVHFPTGM